MKKAIYNTSWKTTELLHVFLYFSELFQIFFYDQELLEDKLKLVYGSEGNLSCIYRNSTHGRWKIMDFQVYYQDPLHSTNVQKNNAGLYSCISEGHKRTITVEVLCKITLIYLKCFKSTQCVYLIHMKVSMFSHQENMSFQ